MGKTYIPIHPKDKNFARLLGDVKEGILNDDKELIEIAKKEFAEADISLFYNEDTSIIRVVHKGSPPVDFPLNG